jgi:uncharacterized protein (TIGR02757 family)
VNRQEPSPLGFFLDRLHQNYHRAEYLSSDPLEFVHHYQDPWDQEAVALIAGLLAYGNVKQIRRSVTDLLGRMERAKGSPRDFVRAATAGDPGARTALQGFVHRFNRGPDLVLLLELLGRSWTEHGSLGAHFLSHLEPDAQDFSAALNALISDWLRWAGKRGRGSFRYLLTAPEDGSCCKRWCMFLRWMGRKDGLDPGLWTEGSKLASTFPQGRALRASQLVLPLDTHTGRISQYLGLTRRKTLNWRAATEITEKLRAFNADDPVRYDFALARLGILDLCTRTYRAEVCERCDLVSHCRFAARGRSRKQAA